MMRSFRSKPVGWARDNYRHYLAAKYGSAGARRYSAIVRVPDERIVRDPSGKERKVAGEYVHETVKGETYHHIPGENSGGFYGRTLTIRAPDTGEVVEMKGPWHTTASDVRRLLEPQFAAARAEGVSSGALVVPYDDYEPEYWGKRGVLSPDQVRKLAKVEGTYLKEFLKGRWREEDPVVAYLKDPKNPDNRYAYGGKVHASELKFNLPEDPREVRRLLPSGWTTGANYREDLYGGKQWYGEMKRPGAERAEKTAAGMKMIFGDDSSNKAVAFRRFKDDINKSVNSLNENWLTDEAIDRRMSRVKNVRAERVREPDDGRKPWDSYTDWDREEDDMNRDSGD